MCLTWCSGKSAEPRQEAAARKEAMVTLACTNFTLQGRRFINEAERRILDQGKANKTDIVFVFE